MKKIMLVDDEKSILNSLKRELMDWCSDKKIEIISFTNPIEAFDALEIEKEVFLVISDLRMPEMLGSDLLLKIREKYSEIITILLTGYSEIDEIMKAVKSGIFAYILKPWDEKYLLTEINKAHELSILKEEKVRYIKLLEEELKWGGELQKKILKREIPVSKTITVDVEYQPLPMLYCGGDYYDIIALPNDNYLVLLGDVAGHGLKAAFITTILKTIIFSEYVRNNQDKGISPADFLKWLNKRISLELSQFPDMLITFVALVVNPEEKKITFSNAGQSHFYLVRGNKVHPIHDEGLCLNITDDPNYRNKSFKIETGDQIYMFTDGLIEVGENKSNLSQELTGQLLLDETGKKSGPKEIIESFRSISTEGVFYDDITLLSIRIN
ncbi:MAG: fused response regulator/phosphatase [Spirochaetia bacterium]|jgi:sigma-B regulation protein RsbU (phosphoserine phosphatase)|nr:fused response regulator/phosphatase [Spirochaetia bacterium]